MKIIEIILQILGIIYLLNIIFCFFYYKNDRKKLKNWNSI